MGRSRTQRSYDSRRGAARLLGPSEQRRAAELARRARAIGDGDPQRPRVLVSAVPVYGLELQERRQKFLANKVGPYEIDFEAWHSNLQGLVDFMRMLAEEPAPPWCLLLSGDVHYVRRPRFAGHLAGLSAVIMPRPRRGW